MRAYKEWRLESVCLTGDALTAFRSNSRKAKAYCQTCPVKRDCLNYALLYGEDGIWGGTTETDRAQILSVAPQIQDILRLEALQAGILEHRYTMEEYWESVRQARKLAAVDKRQAQNYPVSPVVPVPPVEEFEALLEEWNTQLVS
jgi:WhiB family redox-sensing transcriptional regulator